MFVLQFIASLLAAGATRRQRGQGLVEYALILVLISVVAIVIMTTVGGQIVTVFTGVSNALNR